jgi:AraC-like DNA-binding protein
VADRTLRLYCSEYLGMPLHRYVHVRRMEAARSALLAADPARVNVTTVAVAHHFYELGRFSADYRLLFGELPSVTLRRTGIDLDGPQRHIGGMARIVTSRYRNKQRHLAVLPICMLIGLAVTEPALSAENAFDGAYTGKRVLTKGPTPQCVSSEDVSGTIAGGALTFTDSALRNYSIGFDPHPDGSFGEISTGSGGTGVLIQGRIVGGVPDADVSNGPCEHHWHLTKKPQ